jgi:hypothetical protein
MTIVFFVVLVLAALVAIQYWALPALWTPLTDPDANQDECRGGVI